MREQLFMLSTSTDDIPVVALCTWKEARGEGELGMKAVMDVIFNRARDWRKDLHDIVYARNQFTSMSVPSDPEYNLEPHTGDVQYQFCVDLAGQIIAGNQSDITNGSHYYANLKTADSGWFKVNITDDPVNHPQRAVIGKQTFYL